MKWRLLSKGSKALISLSVFILLGQLVFSTSPQLAEQVYGTGLYPIIRKFLDLLSWPISGIYALLSVVLIVISYQIFKLVIGKFTLKVRMQRFAKAILKLLAVLFVWFYLFWGYNYNRPDILERMEVTSMEPDTAWIFSELRDVIATVNELRQQPELAHLDQMSETGILSTNFAIDEINNDLEAVLPLFKYDLKIDPQFRFIAPAGVLLHWSTAGIYWPFSGESNVDRGVHYIKKPVTVAHELAHAHGLTSEGDCNFVAYLACVRSDDPILQYSGHLSYLNYLMRDALKILGREGLTPYYNLMSPAVRADRNSIFEHHNKYVDYFPKLRNQFYDTYLKSQGVKGGIANYNYFVKLKYNLTELE